MKIGVALQDVENKKRIKLVHEYAYVFAWSYQDIPGLDTNIVVHKLPLKEECPHAKQKLRRTRPNMDLKIREEVRKHFNVEFLVVSEYPQWVANIVSALKKDGKIWICVDYRDQNRANPKDDFSLSHIDVLVDNTT